MELKFRAKARVSVMVSVGIVVGLAGFGLVRGIGIIWAISRLPRRGNFSKSSLVELVRVLR